MNTDTKEMVNFIYLEKTLDIQMQLTYVAMKICNAFPSNSKHLNPKIFSWSIKNGCMRNRNLYLQKERNGTSKELYKKLSYK